MYSLISHKLINCKSTIWRINSMNEVDKLEEKNRETALEAWNEINPYMNMGKKHPKSILDLLDDLFDNCVSKYPKLFLKDYYELGQLTRCRKGFYTENAELFPPSIEFAIDNDIVNRWNPPDRRYLYLAHTYNTSKKIKGYTENEYTCFMEMRASNGTQYTFADFTPKRTSEAHRILNMNYSGLTARLIDEKYDEMMRRQAEAIALGLLEKGIQKMPSKDELLPLLSEESDFLAIGLVGEKILEPICNTIFIPIDDDTCATGEEREIAYKSFHILADYLEKKDINGIIYPSTRTKKEGYNTENIVIFSPEDFEIEKGTIRHISFAP